MPAFDPADPSTPSNPAESGNSLTDALGQLQSEGIQYDQIGVLGPAPALLPADITATYGVQAETRDYERSAQGCSGTWTPSQLKFKVNPSTGSHLGDRYYSLHQTWGAARLANMKCRGPGLEPNVLQFNPYETVRKCDTLHCYTEKVDHLYLGRKIADWESNLPGDYLDSRLSDPGNELDYTMGSTKTSEMKANTDYRTYVRSPRGNDLNSLFKLQYNIMHLCSWHFVPGTPTNLKWCNVKSVPFSRLIEYEDFTAPNTLELP